MTQSTMNAEGEAVGKAVEEYFEAIEKGQRLSIDEFASRHPEIESILRSVIPVLQIAEGARDESAHLPLGRYTQLGDFRLLRQIGRGGMGLVYEAEQISMGRCVALKVLPFIGLADDLRIKRFQNEVRAAAALDHPNIVSIFTIGQERGVHYYAMQLVRGRSLDAVITALRKRTKVGLTLDGESISRISEDTANVDGQPRKPPLRNARSGSRSRPPSESDATQPVASESTIPVADQQEYFRSIAALGIQAARALEHAHGQGIIHRDIKPANLLVDHETNLFITDFGLARIEADTALTMTGDVIGTLRYMAPEQASGSSVAVDARADIYSLATSLYELLTLSPAYSASDRKQLLHQIAFEEPKMVRRVNREIPVDLAVVIHKAMSKDRDDRYATAGEFAEDLQRFLDHRPIRAKRPSVPQLLRKWTRRNPGTVWLGILCCAAALTAALFIVAREKQHAAHLQQLLAEQYFRRGQIACDDGLVTDGLHWFARAWETAPADNQALRHVLLDNLSAWAGLAIAPRSVFAHTNPIYVMNYSPDASRLVSADIAGTVRIWATETGTLIHEAQEHQSSVSSLTFSDDGVFMLTGGGTTARLWSTETGRILGVLPQRGRVIAAAFLDDAKMCVTVSTTDVRTWNTVTGDLRSEVAFKTQIQGAVFSADRSLLATRDINNDMTVISVATGDAMGPAFSGQALSRVRFTQDATRLLTRNESGEAQVWSVPAGTLLWTAKHFDEIVDLEYSPQEDLVATAGEDGSVRLWSADGGHPLGAPLRHDAALLAITFSPDGQMLATIDEDACLRLWSTRTRRMLKHPTRFDTKVNLVTQLAFAPDGQRLLVVPFGDHGFELDLSSLQSRIPAFRLTTGATSSAFSPSGQQFLTGAWGGNVNLWLTETGEALGQGLSYPGVVIWDVAFSPTEPYALAAGGDGVIRVLSVTDNQMVESHHFRHPGGHVVRSVAFNADGSRVVTGGWDGTARVWSTTTWTEVLPPLKHPNNLIESVTFTPGGERVVTACGDGAVRFWDASTGALSGETIRHAGVLTVAISPDGQQVLTGGRDDTARTWDMATRTATGEPLPHSGDVECALYSEDGTTLITATAAGEVYAWSSQSWERTGPPLVPWDDNLTHIALPRNNQHILVGNHGRAELWWLHNPPQLPSRNLPAWVQRVTRKQFTAHGRLQWLPRD